MKNLLTTLLLCGAVAATHYAQASATTELSTLSGTAPPQSVVYIEEVPGAAPPATPDHVVMDQVEMEFTPTVLPVVIGTTVEFHNSDAVVHNVFSPDECADSFNLGNWGQGESRSYTFESPCSAVVLCSLHPEMFAYVVVVPTVFFAKADESGAFRIEGLPDGTYEVTLWSMDDDPKTRTVTVSGNTTVDFGS